MVRAIEVVLNGIETWGAVGFRNSANNSNEDKASVKRKFNSDLMAAINENAELKSFVFLTNVSLTPAELRSLMDSATSKSIPQCDSTPH